MTPLENVEQLQMMNQQQPPQQQSPFMAGNLAAMEGIRQSLRMDDDQKKRALGMAISKFAQGMGNPANYMRGGNGLGAAAASLGPATEAYDAQEQASRSENANLIEYMRKIEHDQKEMARHKKEHEDMMAYRNASLEEDKRHHDMQNGVNSDEFQKIKAEGLVPENALYIGSMPKAKQTAVYKQQIKDIEKGEEAGKVLHILDRIDELNEKYPKMYKDFNTILYEKASDPEKDMSGWIKSNAINEEAKTALDEMNKLTTRLVLSETRSLNGIAASNMAKGLIAQGKPNFGMTGPANTFVTSGMRKEYLPSHEHGLNQHKAMQYDGYIPAHINKYEKENIPKSGLKENQSSTSSPGVAQQPPAQPQLTKESARDALRKQGIPEEKIPLILQQGGF